MTQAADVAMTTSHRAGNTFAQPAVRSSNSMLRLWMPSKPGWTRISIRGYRSETEYIRARQKRSNSILAYVAAGGVLTLALSYAAVPLYRMFCQASGFAGTVGVDIDPEKIANMTTVEDRVLRIKFNADTGATMRWKFKPQQKEVYLVPGETNLAFYSAENTSDEPIIGISTYNVIPYDAGQYFMKIQCFCFEEQRLNPHEQVDMPVFFYIDPAFADDPVMKDVDEITLSYTFFKSRDALDSDTSVQC